MRYLKLRFVYKPAACGIEFVKNPANTFRGALGYQLAKLACNKKQNTKTACRLCEQFTSCAYALCYETGQKHVPTGFSLGNTDMPHFMSIDANFAGLRCIKKDQSFSFTVLLYSRGVAAAKLLLVAAKKAGEVGFTTKNIPCRLIEIIDETTNNLVWSASNDFITLPEPSVLAVKEPQISLNEACDIKLFFLTPMAFKNKANNSITTKPDFYRIIGSLMRRYSAFEAADGHSLNWSFASLSRAAKTVQISSSSLNNVFYSRYSTRQKRQVPLMGSMGGVVYTGYARGFKSLLKAGEIIRCGRNTTLGQGKFTLVSLDNTSENFVTDKIFLNENIVRGF